MEEAVAKHILKQTDAKNAFQFGTNMSEEDSRLGLKYILLRLRDRVNITNEDLDRLRDLVTAACRDEDITAAVNGIRNSLPVPPFSAAIADVIESGNDHRKAVCLGAIFGAHGMACAAPSDDVRLDWAISGAVAGAIAAGAIARLEDRSQGIGPDDFLVRE